MALHPDDLEGVFAFVPAIDDAPTGWEVVFVAVAFVTLIVVQFWRRRKSDD
jgi:hypothetical protein